MKRSYQLFNGPLRSRHTGGAGPTGHARADPAPSRVEEVRAGRGGANAAIPGPAKPYDRVITKDAKTTKGLFTVHQIKERYYYEIPKSELGRDFLWNSQIAKTAIGVGYGGGQLADLVIRWELKGNRVLLQEVNLCVAADPASRPSPQR